MGKTYSALAGLALLCSSLQAQVAGITGFSESSAAAEWQTEARFDSSINRRSIGNTLRELSAKPHHLGSPGSREVAEKILQRFREYGFDAHIETYQVLFPTPKKRVLEMTAPTVYRAVLKEPALKEDASSGQEGQLPTYNAYSHDGNVTAPLVFVNYGLPEDYETLAKMGIDVKGRIVIAKYGMSWRGIKPKVAQEHGAVGCIIYSDPKGDGYFEGDVYPKGPYKNEYGVQRGSVMDMPIYPGDPLTPGIAATANAKRIASPDEAPNLLKIPVLPISYHDAIPLLEALAGPVAPESWRGALPFTYHVGPGKAVVHLELAFDWKLVPCYDVIAKLQGSDFPDEWVIRGNHHDAWVNGAHDPCSGQASLLAEAEAVGRLVKSGWKPRRTIVYCAWDGEEPALLGSTEWAEDHGAELKQHAVLYINSDMNGRGFLSAGGSQALEGLVNEVAAGITDPQMQVSVLERWKAYQVAHAAGPQQARLEMERKTMPLNALGSGSDYSPFLQHLGVPCLDIGYGGEDEGGEYHSIYDSYDFFTRFDDPGFYYAATLAKTVGHLTLRMANADMLPFDFSTLFSKIKTWSEELQALISRLRETAAVEDDVLKAGYLKLAADTAKPFFPPGPKEKVPFIDFSPLLNALPVLDKAIAHTHEAWQQAKSDPGKQDALNQRLYRAEQQLLLENGLPGRPWYQHALYAPGLYTGYGVKTMPGIREAIEQRQFAQAETEIRRAAAALLRLAEYLEKT
jgi:N-acetylated-alpha-linked acidic dipeptidase